jgi:Mn-dependent DtxR family transcriptional regulator
MINADQHPFAEALGDKFIHGISPDQRSRIGMVAERASVLPFGNPSPPKSIEATDHRSVQ